MAHDSVVSFSNSSAVDLKHLKSFVAFQRDFYADVPQAIPLLKYEYLGSRLLGVKGVYERRNPFFKHGDCQFFLAHRDGKVVGRIAALVDHNYNRHWNDKLGFFGQFECIDDVSVAKELLGQAEAWLRAQGMTAMRGPQNFPMNESTPGVLIEGFDSRPVIYYHYNRPYYARLLTDAGLTEVKKVKSYEVSVTNNGIEAALQSLSEKLIRRYDIKLELWADRPLEERKREMFEVYNDAWNDNFGFVPFERDEFYTIIHDLQLVMDKHLFLFVYSRGELAAFFGGIPNAAENLAPTGLTKYVELLRAAKVLARKSRVKGFRLGYLGVRKKFRGMGLDGLMLWKQSQISLKRGYQYCDIGWVLEDNVLVNRLVERCGGAPSKTYAIFQKPIV